MIENRLQCENARAKLEELQQLYDRKRNEPGDTHVRELTLRSLKQRINRFEEELTRYEVQHSQTTDH